MNLHATPPGLQAHIPVPQPVPTGPQAPPEQPVTVPTPERTPPGIGDPLPEPSMPIREPGIIKPPQAALAWLH